MKMQDKGINHVTRQQRMQQYKRTPISLVLFLLAGATDILDGYLARRFSWGSTLGKVLDPVADKSMQCTVLVVLVITLFQD